MKNFKVGDRLIHHTGTEYRIHAVYPSGSAMIGTGADDRVAITKEELHGYQEFGETPWLRRSPNFSLVM